MLKVIKILHDASEKRNNTSNDEPVINHTLDGHTNSVIGITWNESFHKLVSSDENGLTIVWGLQDGIWHQEMIHNRKTSLVVDMKWTFDGELICIAYQDGAVIVGSVEGSRVWEVELNASIRCLAWTPNNNYIVFVKGDNTIIMYDKMGNHMKDIKCDVEDDINHIHWQFSQRGNNDRPLLFMTRVNGQITSTNIMKNSNKSLINSDLLGGISLWNPYGNILALCGTRKSSSESDENSTLIVQFYNKDGSTMHEMTLCKKEKLVNFEWVGSGLKLAVATEKCIYFVDIRHQYKWTSLNAHKSLAYQCFEVRVHTSIR